MVGVKSKREFMSRYCALVPSCPTSLRGHPFSASRSFGYPGGSTQATRGYYRGTTAGAPGSFPKYLRAISGLPGSYFWSTTGQLRFYHRVTDGPQRARARRMNSTAFRLKSFQGVPILVFGLTSWWFRTMVLRYRLASAQRF